MFNDVHARYSEPLPRAHASAPDRKEWLVIIGRHLTHTISEENGCIQFAGNESIQRDLTDVEGRGWMMRAIKDGGDKATMDTHKWRKRISGVPREAPWGHAPNPGIQLEWWGTKDQ